jgi:choline dehydrogenase
MQDNYEASVHITAEEPWVTYSPLVNCTLGFNASDPCFLEWETCGSGPYAGSYGTMFLTWRSSVSWDDDADLFWLSIAGYGNSGFYPGFSSRQPIPNDWITSIVRMQTVNPSGTVKLRSKDPRQAPDILFNYFAENAETDLQAIADGIDLTLRGYDDVGIPWTQNSPDPAIDVRQAVMDEAFSHHATSTCRMGPVGDPSYCVDSKFRVNGVRGLRVVDASVFPRVPGAFPNAPTFTISQKAFEVILEAE